MLHTLLLNGGVLDSRLNGNVKGCLSERSFLRIGHTDRQTVPRALQSWCIMSNLKVSSQLLIYLKSLKKLNPGKNVLHSNIIESIRYCYVNFLESSIPPNQPPSTRKRKTYGLDIKRYKGHYLEKLPQLSLQVHILKLKDLLF